LSTKVKNIVKPFVKWAGGKGQLLKVFENFYPAELANDKIKKYIEPFVGGGAVLFDILQSYDIEQAYIFDINSDLINAYLAIKNDVNRLIEYLEQKEKEYIKLDFENRKNYYYQIRNKFNAYKLEANSNSNKNIERAGHFIFLNKTCFNGLYRVNSEGLFNVPMGDYKNPKICDEENLSALSELLQKVEIFNLDYRESLAYADERTLMYFDPPYRPLNTTSSFTSYTKSDFTDSDQIELARFYSEIKKTGAYLMLSNSDPKNVRVTDTFLDDLYNEHYINTVQARRTINSKADKRGFINELLVTSYDINGGQNEIYQVL